MKGFDLENARAPACLLFECLSGSRAYGTDTPESDTDLRGVFVLPRPLFYGLARIEHVSDPGHNETYFEIGRFVELLGKNNPNLLEILYSDEGCVRYRHPLFDLVRPEHVLSKLCESTFAGYAMAQVRKARGLNKKIANPMEGPRRSILDFCHVVDGQGSIPLRDWLMSKGLRQEECGLVKVPHTRDVHAVFAGLPGSRGIVSGEESTEVLLSSVPKGAAPLGWMSFNKDGFKKHCREYQEYRDWLANRNKARHAANVEHGRNYDSKNLMHTFRLLGMAEEIATERRIAVRRPDRDFLMRIRRGEFAYEELIAMAEEKIEAIGAAFAASELPELPDLGELEKSLVAIREEWYS